MGALLASRRSPSSRSGEWSLSSVRPITLLIASGILLIAGILIVTGMAAGHLREQALINTEAELARLDRVLAQQADRLFHSADALLEDQAAGIATAGIVDSDSFARAMSTPAIRSALRGRLAGASQLSAIELVGADGRTVNTSSDKQATDIDHSGRDYFKALTSSSSPVVYVGAPLRESAAEDAVSIPLARKILNANGALIGLIVGMVPVAAFERFYQQSAISEDSAVSLMRADGMLLARYPRRPNLIGRVIQSDLLGVIGDKSGGTARGPSAIDGQWKVKAMSALPDFPAGVLLSRVAAIALTGWSHQAVLFAVFAISGVTAIAGMVMLIARQFSIYSALTVMRAQKIEAEHARLIAEAELLKKERLSVLGQLTATVAHELRNPLSAIRNTLFSIKEMATSKGVKLDRPVARMERSIERCDRIISDLLEYTRNRTIHKSAVTFDPWVDEVLGEQMLPAGVTLITDFAASEARVPIDADRIRRVVINLVDNAAQAMTDPRTECAEKRIVVRTVVRDDMLHMTIMDTGPGIAPENLLKIFEPLFSTKSFGTGLGLSTVKQIVGQHDGSIDVESEVGRGTSVVVRLPLRHPEPVAAAA